MSYKEFEESFGDILDCEKHEIFKYFLLYCACLQNEQSNAATKGN